MADFNSGRSWAAWASPGLKIDSEQLVALRDRCDQWRKKGLTATDAIGGWPGGFEYADLKTYKCSETGMIRLSDESYRMAFEEAQAYANEQAQKDSGSGAIQVDPYLHQGGLSNKSCGFALQIATNEMIFPATTQTQELWDEFGIDYIAIHYAYARTYLYWDADKVASLFRRANWRAASDIVKQKKAPMAIFHSARAFLSTCNSMKLGIRFASQ